MKKVLVLDSEPVIVNGLVTSLSRSYHVICCEEPEQLLDLLTEHRPDLLIVDLTTPGVDALAYLKTAYMAGVRPKILATSRYVSSYVTGILCELNVGCLLMRPCTLPCVLTRAMDMLLGDCEDTHDMRRHANELLLQLGLRMDLQGYQYVLESVLYVCDHPGCTMISELYPDIALKFAGTAVQVERAIRLCIQNAWNRKKESVWSLYFPLGRNGKVKHLTNGEFLKRIAFAVTDFYSFVQSKAQ